MIAVPSISVKAAEGRTPKDCVRIAESISGDETVSNAVAYCMAAERISGVSPTMRAWHLRTVLLELERMYSLLGDLAGMVVDVAFPVGASPFFVLREELLRWNRSLTGSRFMKGAVTVGGMNMDVAAEGLDCLSRYLPGFDEREQARRDIVDPVRVPTQPQTVPERAGVEVADQAEGRLRHVTSSTGW